jgi:hypothetical protein
MNTEMKVRDYDNFMAVHDVYTRAYNAGKTDVIKIFVERIKKDIGHMKFIDGNAFAIKREIEQVINKRMREALGNED